MRNILIFLFIFFSFTLKAQDIDFVIGNHNNTPCYVTIIEKGQTLYSISKKFTVEVKEIEDFNDGLKEGLKLGATLYIPIKSGVINHIVEKGQTLYSIARMYQIDKNKLIKDNDLKDENLKLGQPLLVILSKNIQAKKVVKTDDFKSTIDANPTQIIELKKEIEAKQNGISNSTNKIIVALLLPLHLDKNFGVDNNNSEESIETKTPPVFTKSYSALDFYNGIKLACDSTSATKQIEIITLDCPSDTLGVQQLLLNKDLKRANILVGPFNSNYAPFVAEYCKKHKIIYCSPFGQQGKLLLNNEYAFKASASATTELEGVALYLKHNLKSTNCIVVHNGLKKEKNLVEAFKLKYNLLGGDSAKEIIFKDVKLAGLKNKLSNSKTNNIVVCSNDQAFVTDFINKLSSIKDDYILNLFGTEQWLEYENLEVSTIQNLNLHLPSNYYINYSDSLTKKFIVKFRKEFYQEPTRASFLGYDLMSMFLANCQEEITSESISKYKYTGLHIVFDFIKTSHESGFENRYTPILKYEDLMLKAVVK